jgi:hypothetical protein
MISEGERSYGASPFNIGWQVKMAPSQAREATPRIGVVFTGVFTKSPDAKLLNCQDETMTPDFNGLSRLNLRKCRFSVKIEKVELSGAPAGAVISAM